MVREVRKAISPSGERKIVRRRIGLVIRMDALSLLLALTAMTARECALWRR
jgi:hypothetical protein